jgi:hypothetical protein
MSGIPVIAKEHIDNWAPHGFEIAHETGRGIDLKLLMKLGAAWI